MKYVHRFKFALRGFRYLGFRWFLPCGAYLIHPLLRKVIAGRTISVGGYRARIGQSDLFVLGQIFGEYPVDRLIPALRRCDRVIDAGANVGAFCWLARRIAPELAITAIEPEESNFRALASQSFARALDLRNAAVGPRAGSSFLVRGESSASHTVTDAQAEGCKVEVITLEELCAGSCRVVLKLDIEGGEKAILEAGVPDEVKAMFIEWHFTGRPPSLRQPGVWTHHGGNSYSWSAGGES